MLKDRDKEAVLDPINREITYISEIAADKINESLNLLCLLFIGTGRLPELVLFLRPLLWRHENHYR